MELPKRTENRPPRPPVPKFRLIGAGTDTPDFLPPPKSSEESSFIALSQDNLSETSSDDSQESYFARKRMAAIVEEMTHYINMFGLKDELLKIGLEILKPELLDDLKQKKYNAIAIAVLIAALKRTSTPITQKEILAKTSVSEKQIKKILLRISNSYSLDQSVISFVRQICQKLGLNEKFIEICSKILKILLSLNLITGEHENVIAAAIIKFTGDIIFADRGGIIINVIADHAKCNQSSLRLFLKKMESQYTFLVKTLFE